MSPDEFDNPDDLELGCAVNGEQVQHARTNDLIFSVPALVARSRPSCPCYPETSSSPALHPVSGSAAPPQRWLAPGDELVSTIEGIGELRQHFVVG